MAPALRSSTSCCVASGASAAGSQVVLPSIKRAAEQIRPWQLHRDSLNNRLPDVLATAGVSVFASDNPHRQETISFRLSAWIARRKGHPTRVYEAGRGPGAVSDGRPMISILSETAGAREKRKFFNGLILEPA
jgi:hypothetical protein